MRWKGFALFLALGLTGTIATSLFTAGQLVGSMNLKAIFKFTAAAGVAFVRGYSSPADSTEVVIGGKTIGIKYHAPSMHGRSIFGPGGVISKAPTYPVWRAGANQATALHTDADLDIGGLAVPRGDYTLFIQPEPGRWQLIVNKQTGQWGLEYHQDRDLGRVAMNTARVPLPIKTLSIRLTPTGGDRAQLVIEWENVSATVPVAVK
jgi:hypothetical protein